VNAVAGRRVLGLVGAITAFVLLAVAALARRA